jgi:hypothetical protein
MFVKDSYCLRIELNCVGLEIRGIVNNYKLNLTIMGPCIVRIF